MNQDALRVHYATLYEIVCSRYNGLSPTIIEQRLDEIDDAESSIDFNTNPQKSKKNKTSKEKRMDYIHAEVYRALKILTKQPVLDECEFEDFDIDELDDEDFNDDLEKEDYCNYPHTLVIGIKNKKSNLRNSGYRLNRNISFSSQYSKDEFKIACKFLYTLYATETKHLINSDMVTFITKEKNISSKQNNKTLTLLIDTFVQLELHELYTNNMYSLDILLGLISMKANLNMILKTKNSVIELKNIVINELVFGKDNFQIVCNESILTINDIKDIQLIESSNENSISTNISLVQNILLEYSENIQEYFKQKIDDFSTAQNIFFQPY